MKRPRPTVTATTSAISYNHDKQKFIESEKMIEETKIKKLKESKLYRASYDIVGGCEKTLGPDSNIYSE